MRLFPGSGQTDFALRTAHEKFQKWVNSFIHLFNEQMILSQVLEVKKLKKNKNPPCPQGAYRLANKQIQ